MFFEWLYNNVFYVKRCWDALLIMCRLLLQPAWFKAQ